MSLKNGQTQPLVSMETYRVMMKKTASPLFSAVFHPFLLNLQVTMTCMKARTSWNFGLIGSPTAESVALERLEKKPMCLRWEIGCLHFLSAVLDQILFILAGNDYINESLDEFEIQPDSTTGSRAL